MSFRYEDADGIIEMSKKVILTDNQTIQLGCPRLGTQCSFRILNMQNFSTGQTITDRNISLAKSAYCHSSKDSSETSQISTTIGFTSCSELDRLLDVCLMRLRVGEVADATIQCSRSRLSCSLTIELLSIIESYELHELSPSQIYLISSKLKSKGVQQFTDGFTIDAFYKFNEAMKYLCLQPPTLRDAEHAALVTTLRSNLGSCHIKMGNWKDAIDLCNTVLETDSLNVKALYRRGCSYMEMQEFDKAQDDLLKAQGLDPENKAVKGKLALIEAKEKALDAKYARAMKKFCTGE